MTSALLSLAAAAARYRRARLRRRSCSAPSATGVGRRAALIVSLLIISAEFLIGLLPTYASIGVLAPILLVVLRMAQGFALGGGSGAEPC